MYSLLGNSWYVVGEFFAHPRTHDFGVIASSPCENQSILERISLKSNFLESPLSMGNSEAYVPNNGAAIIIDVYKRQFLLSPYGLHYLAVKLTARFIGMRMLLKERIYG